MNRAIEHAALKRAALEVRATPVAEAALLASGAGRAHPLALLGEACLWAETAPASEHELAASARASETRLRELSSETWLRSAGILHGYRMEDLLWIELHGPEESAPRREAWWRRRLSAETEVFSAPARHVFVRALFAARGALPSSQRQRYTHDGEGRIRVEAFELHVTEHCNLRCAHCCNTSPYLPEKTLAPESIAATLSTISQVLHADVFKIMGGEPLLHPRITEVLRVVKESGIGDVVRLFTNGLLLFKMDDAFWRALDQLTVSTYASAPVRPAHLALIEEKARAFDVVLNVKPVDQFSQVMHDAQRSDDAEVQKTWDRCWLRHRCLVARDGRFYICTRAAYLEELHTRVALSHPYPDAARRQVEDSVALDDPALREKMLALLNRTQPLHSCRFCLGGDGPRERHTQLGRDDVRAGRLRRLPRSAE